MRSILIILFIAAYVKAATLRNDSNGDTNVTPTPDEVFIEKNIVYRGQHDIVQIYFPIFFMDTHKESGEVLFFVEADRNDDGSQTDRGLYVQINKDSLLKLLDNGRDVDGDGTGNVYFAANDGIYIYNDIRKTADKFSAINESLISIAIENNTGTIHALNENHVLYTITLNGAKAEINYDVKDAQEIAMDIKDDSLFYYDANKNAYVLTKEGKVIKISGLPEKPAYFKMIKAPLTMDGMLFMVNNEIYNAFSNGTSSIISKFYPYLTSLKPTAYSLEGTVISYYGHKKNIYEYNVLTKVFEQVLDQLGKKITNYFDNIFSS